MRTLAPADEADAFCCRAMAGGLVPRVDEVHTVVASSSCWEVPPAFLPSAAAAAADEDEVEVFLGYVFLRTPPAAAAAPPRSPCRMDTSSSGGGALESFSCLCCCEALRFTHRLMAPWRPNREGAMVDVMMLC